MIRWLTKSAKAQVTSDDRTAVRSQPELDSSNGAQDLPAREMKKSEAFTGALLWNRENMSSQRSIVICGLARGGTSFGGSVFASLGVPMILPGETPLGANYEHRELKRAFLAGEFDTVKSLAAQFSEHYRVWAWKLPRIAAEFDKAAECVPNPHFVMIFKDPMALAVRGHSLRGGPIIRRMAGVMQRYQQMLTIAEKTKHPLLMISYDRAMSDLAGFLPDAAAFADVAQFDAHAVMAGILGDHGRYRRNLQGRLGRDASSREDALD